MAKIKAVLDTNIIVSAVLTESSSFKILKFWRDGKFDLILSNEIIAEYFQVLSREKFCLPTSLVKTIMDEFYDNAVWIKTTTKLNLIKDDPADNKFIETALDGNANCIVSGDRHLLKIKEHQNIKILSPAEFLTKL